jgi:hypothetical protein
VWENIIFYLRNKPKVLKTLRLVCKDFRRLIVPYWKQVIPYELVGSYLQTIKKLNFGIQIIKVKKGKNFIINVDLADKSENDINTTCSSNHPLFFCFELKLIDLIELFINVKRYNVNLKNNLGEPLLIVAISMDISI